jgi:hypothetical protein
MWIHLLALGLIAGAGGAAPEIPETPAGAAPSQEVQVIRTVRDPSLVRRIYAGQANRPQAQSYTSRKPAKKIEQQAAVLALDEGSTTALDALLTQWLAVSPPMAAMPAPDAQALFYAHVAQALERIRIEREQQDEEEAVLALLLL